LKFLLITTGGTIASVPGDKGYAPGLSGKALVEACPQLEDFEHSIDIIDLFSKDSSRVKPEDWLALAACVRRQHNADAVVILHGTDTMAWTAAALSFLLGGVKTPVVLTGSMLPPGEGSDAPGNMYAAFLFAAELAVRKRGGVAIAFAGKLIHGARATKLSSSAPDAFASVDYPLLGTMDREVSGRGRARLFAHIPPLTDTRPWADPPEIEKRIALVTALPGMGSDFLDALIAKKPAAVVLEGFGLGHVSFEEDGLYPAIERGIAAGIPFIMKTQAPFGGTNLTVYEAGRRELEQGVISAKTLTREALLAKLMLLLPVCKDNKTLESELYRNLCGELAI
jgi:L-asparaginase